MEANLKKKLPQEGTSYLLAGESLGEPSGSSCPSYSGGGQDRLSVAAPRNKELTQQQHPESPGVKNSPNPESTANDNPSVPGAKVYQELDDMLHAFEISSKNIGLMEDKSSTIIHKHMLDAVAIIKKVASVMETEEKVTLENAVLDAKEAVEELLKRTDPTFELLEETAPPEMPKEQSQATIQTKSTAPPAAHIADNNNYEFDGDKLITFLKNYFQDTINKYLDTCEDKLLHEWDVQPNENNTTSKTASTLTATDKDSCKISPASEPIYDVFYEMDRFKDFAMKRIEKDGIEKTAQLWFSEPAETAKDDAKIDKPRDGTKFQRQQPFWWTTDIAELRQVYMAARRQYSRSRRRRHRDEAVEMEHYSVYRSVKKALNAAIERARAEGREVPEAEEQEDASEVSVSL
ncbi:hypothetical protein O3G_MSEX010180 [Manduca sexta]|uniref:Uncharacterized protein n=1 Tax=Manduca sexta TaxID=7130 RepID=A0A921ZGZ8_MANSE|nr:hypothetical protein O3G_MSEX010180 [Manduca sexta]